MPRHQMKNEKVYQARRRAGNSKQKAARIGNVVAGSRRTTAQRGGKAGTYENRTKEDLYQEAKKVGIEGRSHMRKDELIKALRRH